PGRRRGPPRPRGERPIGDGADACPYQAPDGMAHRLAHAPHDAIPALVHDDLEGGVLAPTLHLMDARGCCRSVVERDAFPERAERGSARDTADLGEVRLLDAVTGMRDELGELPVVREDEEPVGVVVEPADGEDPWLARNEIDGRGTPFWVSSGRHDAPRLVQQVVDDVVAHADRHAVHLDTLLSATDALTESRDRAVDRDPSFGDQCLGGTPRPEPRSGQDLLEPLPFAGAVGRPGR